MSSIPETTFENEDPLQRRIMLILVGLVASGKSTFARALEDQVPHFRRCNQDDLGNRNAVQRLARESLRQGYSVCIDRTNFDEVQREHWVKLAHEVPDTAIWCLHFDTPFNICAERLKQRTNHPTITSPEQGLEVLHRIASDFRAPSSHEGFDRILVIKPNDLPASGYTRADIIGILRRIHTTPALIPPSASVVPNRSMQFFRGNYHHRGAAGYNWQQTREIQSDLSPSWRHPHHPRPRAAQPTFGSDHGGRRWRNTRFNHGPEQTRSHEHADAAPALPYGVTDDTTTTAPIIAHEPTLNGAGSRNAEATSTIS